MRYSLFSVFKTEDFLFEFPSVLRHKKPKQKENRTEENKGTPNNEQVLIICPPCVLINILELTFSNIYVYFLQLSLELIKSELLKPDVRAKFNTNFQE